MRSKNREPLPFLGNTLDRPVNPRKSNRQLVAEAIHGVVRASGPDPLNREIRPVRMLRSEQTTHQVAIDFHLVVVHPTVRHDQEFRSFGNHRQRISRQPAGLAKAREQHRWRGRAGRPSVANCPLRRNHAMATDDDHRRPRKKDEYGDNQPPEKNAGYETDGSHHDPDRDQPRIGCGTAG
jgi:hypothetical protein